MRFRLALLLTALAFPACAAPEVVNLPLGETRLGDIGLYEVAYQAHDQAPVTMPPSWIGNMEPVAGVSYVPNESMLGRDSIFIHSPWRDTYGRTWVDYRLRLPKATPLQLSFGIAMSPSAVQNKSDGVTFSAALTAGGQTRELMRQHWAQAEWKDYTFDLTPYAGQEVTLRLQVEPGPANSPSFDFSYFGGARIVAGSGGATAGQEIDRLLARRKATDALPLTALSNANRQGVTPSGLVAGRTGVAQAGGGWQLSYEGSDLKLVYTVTPATGTLDDVTVSLDGGRAFHPCAGGGVRSVKAPDRLATGGKCVDARLDAQAGTVSFRWEYPAEVAAPPITWTFGLRGKALTITAAAEQPGWQSLSLGTVGGAALRRVFGVPYLAGSLHYLPDDDVFACRYLDWTVSHSSVVPQGEASYQPKTDGTYNPLLESGYVALSPRVDEVLPNLPSPASPYLDVLGPKIMLDVWGHQPGGYAGDAKLLRDLKDNGVDHMVIITHDWQRYGYDVKLPDHIPANPAYGGDAGMIEFGKAANECGYRWSVHENYIDLYPDAPSYDPKARVLNADGSPAKAWFNPGTGVQSFGLKANRAKGFAEQNSPYIHKTYGTTAAYLDVHPCVPPWHELDHQADQPFAAMEQGKIKWDTELFQYMRDTHQGPLFGEGANHFYWAGRVDGVEAQVAGGENHAPFLDFDLLKIHPQAVNHGMGYYERWFSRGYNTSWGDLDGTPEDIDKYRAQEIAYGHAGFIGHISVGNVQWVAKEHHLMHAVQALYGTAKVRDIRYEVAGRMVPADVALVLGDRSRQRIEYDSGLRVWVNWNPQPWTVEGRTLPQWGWLALGPGTEAGTRLQDGKLADWAQTPEYWFADARTRFNLTYHNVFNVEPRIRECKYLGGNQVQLTYEWRVGEPLDGDYQCFVHFINQNSDRGDLIEFQQDHALPKPTSQWKAGETIVDGPYTVTLPDNARFDSYGVTIGLFGGPRLRLKGVPAPGTRILLGTLNLTRADGKVTNIACTPPAATARREADFRAHLNPIGTLIDFGPIATDGSVKVERKDRSLLVYPYPRGVAFNVRLDLAKLLGGLPRSAVQVHALAAGTRQDLGAVPTQQTNGLSFQVGKPGAGVYRVSW